MLTATYSLALISNEQHQVRALLAQLDRSLRVEPWKSSIDSDMARLEEAIAKLVHLDRYCQERTIERFVIPAMRRAATEVDSLLADLDALNAESARLVQFVSIQAELTSGQGAIKAGECQSAMQEYCRNLLKKLEKEEKDLFPIARSLLSGEEWLSITARCLAGDSEAINRID